MWFILNSLYISIVTTFSYLFLYMFPIWDDKIPKTGVFPRVSYTLIAVNIFVFLYQVSLWGADGEAFVMNFGTIPSVIMSWGQMHTLITNMFLHGGWMHLIGNMLFLWVFADNVEAHMGNIKFLIFYLLGGIVASLSHILLSASSDIPAIGASGAISAVLGAYLVIFPHSKIKMISLHWLHVFYISAIQFLGYWIVFQIVQWMWTLGSTGWGTARWAHIGGFVFGLIVGYMWKNRGLKEELRVKN